MLLLRWLLLTLEHPETSSPLSQSDIMGHIIEMLAKVDQVHFQGLKSEQNQNVQQILGKTMRRVEEYLTKKEGRRMNRQYFRKISLAKQWDQVIAIVLFLTLNSKTMPETVQKIIEYSEQEQNELMKWYKKVEQELSCQTQMKEGFEKIQRIQADNNRLKEALVVENYENQRENTIIKELAYQNLCLEHQKILYEEQLQNIKEEIEVSDLTEFVELCSYAKTQNENLKQDLQHSTEHYLNLRQYNYHLKDDLHSLSKTLKSQMQELQTLRSWYSMFSQQVQLRNSCFQEQETQEQCLETATGLSLRLPLGNNQNLLNVDSKSYRIMTDRTQCTSRREMAETTAMKTTVQMELKIHKLEQELKSKEAKVLKLKAQKAAQARRYHKLARKLKGLKFQHESNMHAYFCIQ